MKFDSKLFHVVYSNDIQSGVKVQHFESVVDADEYAEQLRRGQTKFITVHSKQLDRMIGDYSQRN